MSAFSRSEEPHGFRVPIHRSLTVPITIGGIPRKIAILNGTAVMSAVLGANNLWLLPIGIVSHVVLVMLFKHDADFLAVLKRNLNKPSFLRS